ncbi:MAG: hypothetical protein SWO11_21420 [Thermodesulfobacteriota bacterium]|nr:hypothetical protein [Thermodesulfobacteriota bacterium]
MIPNGRLLTGDSTFYQCKKIVHKAIHGNRVVIHENRLKIHEEINQQAAEAFRDILKDTDIVFIYDAAPAAIIND